MIIHQMRQFLILLQHFVTNRMENKMLMQKKCVLLQEQYQYKIDKLKSMLLLKRYQQ